MLERGQTSNTIARHSPKTSVKKFGAAWLQETRQVAGYCQRHSHALISDDIASSVCLPLPRVRNDNIRCGPSRDKLCALESKIQIIF